MEEDVFRGVGVEVRLKERDDFLKVKETLTRIGVPSRHEKTLYQSCHILHKRGRYSIVHFKELFYLDGKPTSLSDDDIARRNKIALMLRDWGLVEIVDEEKTKENDCNVPIKVLPYKEKRDWKLVAKYSIGMVKR